MVPKDCIVINNRVGSASVSWFERDDKVLVSMPGVPQEMTTVMSEEIIPRLREKFDTDIIIHKTFTVKNYRNRFWQKSWNRGKWLYRNV